MHEAITTAILATSVAAGVPVPSHTPADVAGSWTLVAADLLKKDGSVVRDYGESPKGRLIIDAAGRYSLQIFKAERERFATPDKSAGSDAQFKSAALGSSTHYGQIRFEDSKLVFQIEGASFPNWEGTTQQRSYELSGDELRYRVPPRPDGNVPLSIWRRLR